MKVFYIISVLIFFLSVIGLFKIKLHVQQLNRELIKIKNEISVAQRDLKILHAEWSYLNSPKRLTHFAKKYLKDSSLVLARQIKHINSYQIDNN